MLLKILYIACVLAIIPHHASAQSDHALPIATTVFIQDGIVEVGEVITYDESEDTYAVSKIQSDTNVFGVTALAPALVFATASGTTPVVTHGAAMVKVSTQNGNIQRGDLLVTSKENGVAMKADSADGTVFAVALEPFVAQAGSLEQGSIMAEIGKELAVALQTARQQAVQSATEEAEEPFEVPYARAIIASVVAIGALFFLLYSFRSTIAKGIVSIGRNPRARSSIVALAFGNIVFALILCAAVVFIAVGILILPL